MKTIYLAGGCFWGTEHYFKMVKGVNDTEVGYANSIKPNPSYQEVCTGATHAAETVMIEYNPEAVSLRFLLEMYFHAIDPISVNQQGHDVGLQYRTGIYYVDETDIQIINDFIEEKQKEIEGKIAVEVMPLQNFYKAEDYHQDYLDKNPNGYCHLPLELFEFAKNAN